MTFPKIDTFTAPSRSLTETIIEMVAVQLVYRLAGKKRDEFEPGKAIGSLPMKASASLHWSNFL
jgi:hypothetical protein